MEATSTEPANSGGPPASGASTPAGGGDLLARADDAAAAGRLADALELCEEALRTERQRGPESRRLAKCCIHLADIYAALDRPAAALRRYGRGIAMLGRLPGGVSPVLAHAVSNTGRLRMLAGDIAKAAELATAADALQRQLQAPDSPTIKLNLALVEATAGRVPDADAAFRDALAAADRYRRTIGGLGFAIQDNFARHCLHGGRTADAEMALRSCLILRQEAAGPRHPLYADGLVNLARLHLANDADDEAESLLWQAFEIYRHHGAVGGGLVETLYLLARIAHRLDRQREATNLCTQLRLLGEKDATLDAAAEAAALHVDALLRSGCADRPPTEASMRRALALAGTLSGDFQRLGDDVTEDLLPALANMLAEMGKSAEAERLAARADEFRRQPRWAVTGFVFAPV